MRFIHIATLLCASTTGFVQGRAIPDVTTAVEPRDAAAELGRIVARDDYQCPFKTPIVCTTCPTVPTPQGQEFTESTTIQPTTTQATGTHATTSKSSGSKTTTTQATTTHATTTKSSGSKTTTTQATTTHATTTKSSGSKTTTAKSTTTSKPKCSNKKGCKRDEVYMDDLKDGDWTAEQFLYTTGLSGCTVMAVYDKNNYVMAHIPPGRMDDDGQLTATSLEVIEEFKGRMTTAYQGRSWQNPRAYLLTYATMGQQQRQSLQSWFTSLRNPNINSRQEEVYVRQGGLGDGTNPDAIVVPYGTGNLLIDRRGETWPPRITLS